MTGKTTIQTGCDLAPAEAAFSETFARVDAAIAALQLTGSPHSRALARMRILRGTPEIRLDRNRPGGAYTDTSGHGSLTLHDHAGHVSVAWASFAHHLCASVPALHRDSLTLYVTASVPEEVHERESRTPFSGQPEVSFKFGFAPARSPTTCSDPAAAFAAIADILQRLPAARDAAPLWEVTDIFREEDASLVARIHADHQEAAVAAARTLFSSQGHSITTSLNAVHLPGRHRSG